MKNLNSGGTKSGKIQPIVIPMSKKNYDRYESLLLSNQKPTKRKIRSDLNYPKDRFSGNFPLAEIIIVLIILIIAFILWKNYSL